MIYFPGCVIFLLFGSRVTLTLSLDGNFSIIVFKGRSGFPRILAVNQFFLILLKENYDFHEFQLLTGFSHLIKSV